ncbi:MAG: choice-of-anchor D domain-containing protein [Proteobacteria bacterium]|nr:choice-of-anchor D domain-containing protein [Pseudomonadota bacterium]
MWKTAAVLLVLAGCSEQELGTTVSDGAVAPRVVVDPESVDFGEVSLSDVATSVVTVRNEGNAGLDLTSFGISGASGFSFAWPEPVDTLEVGESTDVIVSYAPGAASEAATLTVNSSDPARPEVPVSLYGTAAYGLLRIEPSPVEFAAMTAGDVRVEEALLVNVGGDALTVDSLAVLGSGFSIVSQPDLPLLIPAGTSASGLELSFASTEDGLFAGQLHAHSDAPNPSTTADLVAYVGVGDITGKICAPGNNGWVFGARVWVEGTYPSGTPWLIETTTDAQGEFTLVDVPLGTHTVYVQRGSWSTSFELTLTGGTYEMATPECLDPGSATVAVVTGDYDHIGQVLQRFEVEYDTYAGNEGRNGYMTLLRDPDAMAEYDIIFFNCGMSMAWLDERDVVSANLRAYVADGGSVYASDWAWGVVEEAWPDAIDFYGTPDTPWDPSTWVSGSFTPYVGVATNTTATVLDDTMSVSVGDTADVFFDLDAWVVVQAAQAQVLIEGDVQLYTDVDMAGTIPFPSAPLVVRYDAGGTVIFTTFHNDQQATADALAILAEIILAL